MLGAVLFSVSTAAAQAEYHLYGGGAIGGEDYTRGAFFGAGLTAGAGPGAVGQRAPVRGVYFSIDGHALWPDETGQAALQLVSGSTGTDVTLEAVGMDLSLGGVIRSSTGRASVIPVALIGFTGTTFSACDRTSACVEETETELNYGAGLVVAFKAQSGRGLHAGFRYTRNYGAALSVGFVFTTD